MPRQHFYYGATLHELLDAFTSIGIDEYAVLSGVALWLVVLLVPLRGIDRRDSVTGFTYMLFCAAAGVTLTLALPVRLASARDARGQIVAVVIFAVTGGLRWIWRKPLPPPETVLQAPEDTAEERRKAA